MRFCVGVQPLDFTHGLTVNADLTCRFISVQQHQDSVLLCALEGPMGDGL